MLKPLILASTLAFTTVSAFAQSPVPAVAAVPVAYQHCLLVSWGDAYASATVQLEYGQKAKTPIQDAQLAQDNEAVAKLGSVVSALNYMSLRGWECISVSTITSKDGAYSSTTSSQVGYLLRRRAQ
ncbi:hypothetical protein [Hymenobacter coccineus]|uniref:DUF4177 domain-containing protein n=1 Tax=Hymenobacter coccineus TaxID=1908235 RepID=A0A1G1SW55_9BACT|nr:hypothetical protein [Hymenobacter coccineus]OGX82856.1 hypothetical protein BEN49_13265 [Hymenobacter coccineus]